MNDPNFDKVVLLCNFNSDSSTEWGFHDYSYYNHTCTYDSSTLASATFKFGNGSLNLSGTTAASPKWSQSEDSSWDIGLQDYTIEFWIKTSNVSKTIFSTGSIVTRGGPHLAIDASGMLVFTDYYDLGYRSQTTGTIAVNTNAWTHISINKVGNTSVKVFVNGVSDISASSPGAITGTISSFFILGYDCVTGTSTALTGNIDDFRYSIGICREDVSASSISIPTVPYDRGIVHDANWDNTVVLIHGDYYKGTATYRLKDTSKYSNSLIASSALPAQSSSYKTQIGALTFNGSDQGLKLVNNNLKFGTGDFTVEFWIKTAGNNGKLTAGNYGMILYLGSALDSGWKYSISCLPNSTAIGLCMHSAAIDFTILSTGTSSTVAPVVGTWCHMLLKRVAGVAYFYKDGALSSSGSFTDSMNYPDLNIGAHPTGLSYFYGSLQELKITKNVGYNVSATPLRATIYSDEGTGVFTSGTYKSSINSKSKDISVSYADKTNKSMKEYYADKTNSFPWYEGGVNYSENRFLTYTDIFGSIEGTVLKDSIPQPNVKVYLYHRPTGRLIATRITNSLGQVSFSDIGISKIRSDYFITALSNDYLAVTIDNILPT